MYNKIMERENRIIIHIDMDAFFASVEQAENSGLKGKPIAISGNVESRSVVSAASYEARRYGVHSAMPLKMAKKLCPNLILIQGDMAKYARISKELVSLYYDFCPAIEYYSIDEVFMDFSYTVKDFDEAEKVGNKIRKEVKDRFHITCTVGVSYNKLLAKLASKLAKPDGLMVIRREEAGKILDSLPVGRITGIGKKTENALLNSFSVKTVGELKEIPIKALTRVFHSYGKFLYNAARGIDDSPVITPMEEEEAKSIEHSITFPLDTDKTDYIKSVLELLSEKVGSRIREHHFFSTVITLTVRYADFTTKTHRKTIVETNSDKKIYETAVLLFDELYIKGRKVRLLGISASGFSKDNSSLLFKDKEEEKDQKIEETMDSIRKRFGFYSVNRGRVIKKP
jgi:DNA polymerase-4